MVELMVLMEVVVVVLVVVVLTFLDTNRRCISEKVGIFDSWDSYDDCSGRRRWRRGREMRNRKTTPTCNRSGRESTIPGNKARKEPWLEDELR